MTMKTANPENKNQSQNILWEYRFHYLALDIVVCRKFLLSLLSISKSRIVTVKNELANNEALDDNRGKHQNWSCLLTNSLQEMIKKHCSLIPHSKFFRILQKGNIRLQSSNQRINIF